MNTKNMWNTAGTAGLALGGVSSIYLILTQLLSGSMEEVSLWQQILSFVLWTIKFYGCIWIMRFFMKKFASENKDADNKDVFRMGMATAVLSAILYSAVNLANMLYISADYYQTLYQTLMEQMSGVLDSNAMTMMEQMIENMPQLTFFYTITYCFLFGTVLSAILSRNIPEKDPFAEYKQEEE